jgi:PHP family Zn ribbon phosphoesterase
MRRFRADLHIHTCLSPCAELEMTPLRIVRRALEIGLDMIAVSDHNSAANAAVAMELGRQAGLSVLPALEISSREEAHVLAVFGSIEHALSMQESVYADLPEGPEGRSEWQVLVNEQDEVLGFERRMLLGATSKTLEELVNEIRTCGGLAIASHVDREAFSVMSQFGFVPGDVIFEGFEVLEASRAQQGTVLHPDVPWVSNSDAHRLADIGLRATVLEAESPEFSELALALRGEGGRSARPEEKNN